MTRDPLKESTICRSQHRLTVFLTVLRSLFMPNFDESLGRKDSFNSIEVIILFYMVGRLFQELEELKNVDDARSGIAYVTLVAPIVTFSIDIIVTT